MTATPESARIPRFRLGEVVACWLGEGWEYDLLDQDRRKKLSVWEDIFKADYCMCWDIFGVCSAVSDVVNLLCDFFPFLKFED